MIANAPFYYNVDLFFARLHAVTGDKQNSTLSLMQGHSVH